MGFGLLLEGVIADTYPLVSGQKILWGLFTGCSKFYMKLVTCGRQDVLSHFYRIRRHLRSPTEFFTGDTCYFLYETSGDDSKPWWCRTKALTSV